MTDDASLNERVYDALMAGKYRSLADEFSDASTVLTEPPTGVWAVIDRGHYESITMVYSTEIEALRFLNGRGYGRAAFLPWGKDITDINLNAQEAS